MNTVEQVYRQMRTESLQELQVAFRLDLEHGADPDFVNGRLAIIERELAARDGRPEPPRVPTAGSFGHERRS